MTRRELGARLAVITALDKAITKAKEEVRTEAWAMVNDAYEDDGISSLDLLIGDEKVGRLGVSKPSVDVYGGQTFAKWAYEHGMGERTMTIDLSDADEDQIDTLRSLLLAVDLPFEIKCVANKSAKKALRIKGGYVVDDNGEVVPGTYVGCRHIHVSGCKPEDVAEALNLLGDGSTIAGLLGGE